MDNKTLNAVDELFSIINMEQTIEQSIETMLAIQLQQDPGLQPFEEIMRQFISKHMSYMNLKPELSVLYSDTFTIQELNEIVTFYKTPVGRKSIATLPDLMNKSAQIGTTKVQENIAELEMMIEEEANRLEQLEEQPS